jgi:hypothetical protein
MTLNLTPQETAPKRARKTRGNGQQPSAEGPLVPQFSTSEAELSEYEQAAAGPDGTIETATIDTTPGSEEAAYAEIEEAIGEDEDEVLEVEETHLTYPIRKPKRSARRFEFFMTHPDPAMWVRAWAIVMSLDIEEEYYLPKDNVKGALADHLARVEFVPCITSRGKIFIWPIPVEDGTGRKNKWTDSARVAAKEARLEWTKLLSDREEGKYRTFRPKSKVPPPVWPEDFTRKTMMTRTFVDRILRDLDNDTAREILNAGHKIER